MTEGATRTALQSFKSGDPNPLQPRLTSKTVASNTEKIESVEGIEDVTMAVIVVGVDPLDPEHIAIHTELDPAGTTDQKILTETAKQLVKSRTADDDIGPGTGNEDILPPWP